MPPQGLAPTVLAFLSEHIGSLEQLDLLLRLLQSPNRWWDAAGLARDLGLSEREARRTLDRFARQNLLDIRITGDVRYQFNPGTETLRAATLAVAEAFRLHPRLVVQSIAGTGGRGVRDFADAFRIRRDDDR